MTMVKVIKVEETEFIVHATRLVFRRILLPPFIYCLYNCVWVFFFYLIGLNFITLGIQIFFFFH